MSAMAERPVPGAALTVPVTTGAPARRQDIEALRLLGCLGIVWYHALATPGHQVAYGALVLFIVLSVVLGLPARGATNAGELLGIAGRRARRLLLPWAVWCVLYALLNRAMGRPVVDLRHGWMAGWLTGPSAHLWYLPFMCAALCLLLGLQGRVGRRGLALGGGLAAAVLLAATPLWRPASLQAGFPVALYLHALPAVAVGAWLAGRTTLTPRENRLLALAVLTAAAGVLPWPGVGLPYLVGLGVVGAALVWPVTVLQRWNVARWAEASFGIYLVHMMVLEALRAVPVGGRKLPLLVFLVSLVLVRTGRALAPRYASWWS